MQRQRHDTRPGGSGSAASATEGRRIAVLGMLAALWAATFAAAPAHAFSGAGAGSGQTYYISPDGDDLDDGLSPATAWQNWARAMRILAPGDTLIVRPGTWTNGASVEPGDPEPHFVNARLPYINCDPDLPPDPDLGVPYANGLPGLPITIRAEDERRSLLRSTGARSSIQALNTSHWTFEGIRGESADLPTSEGGYERSVFMFIDSDNIVLRRMLGAKDNRYFNNDIFEMIRCADSLLEENEAYDFHRHGFSALQSTGIVLRRNYASSRGRADIPGGYVSHTALEGDEGFTCYFSHGCIVENCITEDSEGIQATGDDNLLIGSISIGGWFGFRIAANCQDSGAQACDYEAHYPTGNRGENLLSIDAEYGAFDCDSAGESSFKNVTAIDPRLWGFIGRDRRSTEGFDTSFKISRSLVVRTDRAWTHPRSVAFLTDSTVDGPWRGCDLNAFGYDRPVSPPLTWEPGRWRRISAVDPKLGKCRVFLPEESPMHLGDGTTIGATILYRYDNGVLTGEPLWDPVTGAFPHGAVIEGVNGPNDGDTVANVHERLNVDTGGCDLPASYP